MAVLYRPCVAAILENADGGILIGERADCVGSWQFPQGGLEAGESPTAGLVRELREEISLDPAHYSIGERSGPYHYLFPPGYTKKGFQGQEQHYFRLRLLGPETAINVQTAHPEFRAVRWISPTEFTLDWLAPMKHEVYRQVFADCFGLQIR